MVGVVIGLRTSEQTLNSLTSSLERLCAKEEQTWKERIFNQIRLVSRVTFSLSLSPFFVLLHQKTKKKHLIHEKKREKQGYFCRCL